MKETDFTIYGNKEKIQVLAEQQRTNLADVHSKEARTSSDSYYLDSVDNILQSFGDGKDIYTKDFPKYAEQMENTFGKELFEKIKNKQELSFSESQKLYPNIVDLSEEFGNQAPSEKEVLEKLRSMVGEIYATSTDGKSLRIPQGRDKLSHIFKGDNYKRDFRKKRELNRKLAYNAEKIIGNALFTEAELPKPEKNKDYLLGMHNYEVPVFVNGHGFLVRLEGEVIKKLSTSAPGSIPVQKNTSIESNIDNNELLLKLQATEVSNLYVIRKQKVLFQKGKMIYGNKEKSQENQYAALLMAQSLDSLDSNKILHQTNSLVNKTTSTLVIDSNQAARIKAAREIKENMPNLSENERTAAIAILEAGAKSQGVEFSEYVEKTFPDGIFGDIKKAENAAKQQGVNINGAVSVNGFGENVKAVIYAGKTADFSTWCHELSHIWQAQLAGELKNDAEEAFQVKDSDWQNSIYTFKDGHTDTSAEAFAYGFEDFLKNKAGEMAAEDKKKIFEKFADYMSRTYNGIKQHIEINEKIASVYQKFVELDDNILAQAEKAVQMEVSFSDYFDKTNSVFFELDSGDTTDVSDSILEGKPIKKISTKEFNYDGSNLKDFALNYIKNNPVENAKTKIGNIEISETGLRHSLSHTIYKNKLYAIPAIKDTLEKGTYLGVIKDFEGKRQNNYYFAAPITIDNDKNILFIRVKHVAGRDKALYIHDIFTLDEIKKVTPYSGEPNATRRSLRGATLAKSIIHDYEKNNIIQNNPILFQTAYHGSGANFNKFNISEYGMSGEGSMAFGYGVYVSNSESIAKSYAGRQGERNLYTVEIPDGNYISWEKTVSKTQKENVKNELYKKLIEEDYKGAEKEIFTELNAVFGDELDGKYLYGTVSSYIGSDKETSKFFKDIGFSGIEYPAGTVFGNGQNAVNYVIFNDEDIKIKEHFQFQKQEEERTMKSTETFESQEYWKNQFKQENAETFKAIDDYLDKGIKPKNDEFIFEKVPEILKSANMSENEIVIKTSIINKAKNEHSISDEEIKDSIKNIASPVLVFNSDKTTTENKKESFLCLTDTFAENGKPIAFSMNLDSDYEKSRSILNVNQITSIHDRTLIAKNGTDLIQKWTENGLCRYVDDKKISEWQLAARVQFPLAVLHSDINNINLSPEIVNGTDYQEIRTFSEFAEQQKAMEKEYQEYLGTISPDEESSRRIDSGEIFGKLENQQSKEKASSLSKNYTKVAVGVAPTIQTLRTSASSTALRASTTLATEETISQATQKSINEQKIKMPDQLVYAAAKVGQVIEQRTLEAQSIVNPTRDDRLSTISVPLNKEYNENFALSTVEKLLETEKNAQKATASDFQQIEPALQKKFDKLKAAIKSREEQDIQDISAAEEPGNKKKAIRSKSDIIRQAGKDFLKSVKEGIAPFFNAEDDFQRIIMHPQAIINASNGLPFSGESQLLAQIYHQRQRMEGEVVTSIAGAKAAGTIVLDTPESRQKNFALTDTSSLAEKNAIVRTRYFMPESCEEPDKIYAHTLQRQRPDKIRSYRDLIRHFENIPNGQKEISDIRIRIAHEHLKEIQSRFAIKEKRVLSVDEIEERKNFLRNYFERLPADYRNSERSAFEDTFGIQLNSEKNLEINLQRDFKDIDFAELKKNTKKSIELENRKLSDFIEKNTMEDKKLATLLSDEYKSLSKEEKMTVRNLKIEAIGIKEPETFLGKYLAACNTNAEFITDKETVEEVKKNLVKKLEENFKLEKYDILKEIGQQAQSIGNETTKKISFEKAHSNNKSLEKTQSPDKKISLIGMGK